MEVFKTFAYGILPIPLGDASALAAALGGKQLVVTLPIRAFTNIAGGSQIAWVTLAASSREVTHSTDCHSFVCWEELDCRYLVVLLPLTGRISSGEAGWCVVIVTLSLIPITHKSSDQRFWTLFVLAIFPCVRVDALTN